MRRTKKINCKCIIHFFFDYNHNHSQIYQLLGMIFSALTDDWNRLVPLKLEFCFIPSQLFLSTFSLLI